MIREAVRVWRGGWTSILVLGLGLSIAAEVLILQTSVAPLPWLTTASIPVYDRIWGVNWFWFFFMLGYEAVWIVLVPILITELIFPAQRHEAWLRPRGRVIATLTFLAGSVVVWAIWTQIAMPVAFHVPKYWPPLATLFLGFVGVLMTIVIAYVLRTVQDKPSAPMRRAPLPWSVGLAAMAFGFPWWVLIVLVFVPRPSIPVWLALVGGSIWAGVAFVAIRRWSMGSGWNDQHRWALAFGALIVCMAAGFLGSSVWPRIDLVAKVVLNVIALVLMLAMARVVWRREATPRAG
jgi:hypothetical protein